MGSFDNGYRIIEGDMEEFARLKQASRDRDAELLSSGKMSARELNMRNGLLAGVDFSKVRILKIGGRRYEDID